MVWNSITYLDDPNLGNRRYPGPIIYLFGRDPSNPSKRIKITIPGFMPYFIVSKETAETFREIVRVEYINQFLKKFVMRHPGDVRKIRNILESKGEVVLYEADVSFTNRYLIDNEIKSALEVQMDKGRMKILPLDDNLPTNMRTLFVDIEILARKKPNKNDPIFLVTMFDTYSQEYSCFYLRKYKGKTELLSWDLTGEERKIEIPIHKEYLYDKKGNVKLEREYIVKYYPCDSPQEMMMRIVSFIKDIVDPDTLSGFNVDFDLVNLYKSCKLHGILPELLSPLCKEGNGEAVSRPRSRKKKLGDMLLDSLAIRIHGRNILDLQEAYFSIHLGGSMEMSLDYICKKELKKGKIPLPFGIYGTWMHKDSANKRLVMEYNLRDVELCKDLDETLKLIPFCDEKRKIAGCSLEDAISSKKLLDVYLLRKAKEKGKYLYCSRSRSEKYKGAVILDPIKGLYRWIVCQDYKQLYPTVIASFNIDPEMFLNIPHTNRAQYKISDGHYFYKSPKGLIPEMVEELLALRDIKRKEEQEALARGDKQAFDILKLQEDVVKVLSNATYGVMAYRFRKASKETVESITEVARSCLLFAESVIEGMGKKVIYGDTDSVFWIPSSNNLEDILKEAEEVQKKTEEGFLEFLKRFGYDKNTHDFKFEPDMVYDSFLILDKKKKYAGHYIWNKKEGNTDDYKIMGLESKRTDISSYGQKMQEDLIHKILDHEDKAKIIEWLNATLNSIKTLDIQQLAIPSAISKDMDKFKVNSIGKKAIEYSNEYLETRFAAGDKPKRLYISRSLDPEKYPLTNVLAIDWYVALPDELLIDYPRMLDTVKKKIVKLIDVIGISWNDLDLKDDLALTKQKISFDSDRYQALSRDQFKCTICHESKPLNELVVSIKEKGLDRTIENLATICKSCKKEVKKNCSQATLDSFSKKED